MRVEEYEAVVCIGGRAPEYLRNDARVLDLVRALGGTPAMAAGVMDRRWEAEDVIRLL